MVRLGCDLQSLKNSQKGFLEIFFDKLIQCLSQVRVIEG